ncbi:MAG: hypothetical protein KAS13_02285 [Candidatus Omnitrophica bacterium]|nr:hypothetical protein [Candidatus Omnitrophota bacterium]
MKKEKRKNFLDWFFEEDKSDGLEGKEDEVIEINFFQALTIIIITMCFLLLISYSHLKTYFKKPTFNVSQYIDSKIEKNFFLNGKNLENSDFSQGLKHWVSSDGGDLFPGSKSIVELDAKEYYSAPYSIQIKSIKPANRYHYSKNKHKYIINNAYGYKETDHWLGVIAGTDITASLWYRGDVVLFSIIGLLEYGQWKGLGKTTGLASDDWTPLSLRIHVPSDVRAIALEITLNQAQGMPLPIVWIDDVKVKVKNNEN